MATKKFNIVTSVVHTAFLLNGNDLDYLCEWKEKVGDRPSVLYEQLVLFAVSSYMAI